MALTFARERRLGELETAAVGEQSLGGLESAVLGEHRALRMAGRRAARDLGNGRWDTPLDTLIGGQFQRTTRSLRHESQTHTSSLLSGQHQRGRLGGEMKVGKRSPRFRGGGRGQKVPPTGKDKGWQVVCRRNGRARADPLVWIWTAQKQHSLGWFAVTPPRQYAIDDKTSPVPQP